MNLNQWIRQTHRWLSIVFTTAILVNIAINVLLPGNENLAIWVGMLTLIPLAFLMITGLYLFVLPYVMRMQAGVRSAP